MTLRAPTLARRVLIDTSAFYALSDATEHGHVHAQAISRRLVAERWRIFTTNFVVAEAHALHLSRGNRAVALTFLERLQGSQTLVVRVSARDERRAVEIIRRYDDKDFSFTDAASFAVMERLRIGWAFSFDRDFMQYGFPRIDSHETP
jgi:uncharacterized protein